MILTLQVRPVKRRPERCQIMLWFFSYVGEMIEIEKLKKFIDKNIRGKTIQE